MIKSAYRAIYDAHERKLCRSGKEFVMEAYVHLVQYYETDKMGITHHSNYIRWMEEARVDFLEKAGWPFAKLEKQGFASPVIKVECKYIRPTTFSDLISIRTWVGSFDGIRMVFTYEMSKSDGTVVCVGESSHCFVDLKGKPIRADKACPEFCEAMLAHQKPAEDA